MSTPTQALEALPSPEPLFAKGIGDITIVDLLEDLPWFRGYTGQEKPASWDNWKVFLKATYGLEMTDREVSIFRRFTGRKDPPEKKVSEVWGLCGRRSRKSAIMSLIGVYEAGVVDQSIGLAKGERGRVPLISKSEEDAEQLHSFILAILGCKAMRGLLKGDPTKSQIELTTSIDFTIRAVSIMAGRTKACPCALLDELSFWRSDESANPDREVIAGIRPAMSTFPNPLLVAMTSVYSKTGEVWRVYQDHYRNEGDDVLVWLAATTDMHDSATIRAFVKSEREKDAVAAAAEYDSEFRSDIGPFVRPEIVDAAVVKGRTSLQYDDKHPKICWAFCDPTGGAADSMALGVAWRDGDMLIQAFVCEWKPPIVADATWTDMVLDEMSTILKSYHCDRVTGDHVGGVWLRDPLEKRGIMYVLTKHSKAEIYREILPRLNAGKMELLDVQLQTRQIKALERKVRRGGDLIDHPPGGHDDVCNAGLGALHLVDVYGRSYPDPKPKELPPQTTHEIFSRMTRQAQERERASVAVRRGATPLAASVYRRRRI